MNDTGLAPCPLWRFGMKMADLAGKLSAQYNTITFNLQDPEAFRADVCEISNAASSAEEFHTLMAERKMKRMHELNESLDFTGFEIIANPKLIGSSNWEYAIPVFRDKSLDAVVRYFAHYLPSHGGFDTVSTTSSSASSCYSSFDDGTSVKADSVGSTDDESDIFFGPDDGVLTAEPLGMDMESCEQHAEKEDDDVASAAPSPTNDYGYFMEGGPFCRCYQEVRSFDSAPVSATTSAADEPKYPNTDKAAPTPDSCSEKGERASHGVGKEFFVCPANGGAVVEYDGDEEDDDDDAELVTQFPEDEFDTAPAASKAVMDAYLCKLPLSAGARAQRPRSYRDTSPLQGIRRAKGPANKVHKPQPGSGGSLRSPHRKLD